MEREESQVFMEGVDFDDVVEEEFEDEEGAGQQVGRVEAMNDALEASNFKAFLKACGAGASDGAKPPTLRGFFSKREGRADPLDAPLKAVLERDGAELERLVDRLKNSVLGMRLRLARIVDELRGAEVQASEALSFLNLRAEVLCEYWSFISLFAAMKLNGDNLEGHPILSRLVFLRQFLAKLKPIHKKLDFQISRMVAIAVKDISEVSWNNQEDPLLMRPNLGLQEALDEEEDLDDGEQDEAFQKEVSRRVGRAMESGYGALDKSQKKALIRAIQSKREKMGGGGADKQAQFQQFRRNRLLQSNFVKNIENELEERPTETMPRANIKGVYDPMQDKRDRMDEKNYTKTMLTKDQKKAINKRVERLKAVDKVDDFSEINGIRELLTGQAQGGLLRRDKDGKKPAAGPAKARKSAWMKNEDEEKYDSKRQAKLRRASKIKGKKKGK